MNKNDIQHRDSHLEHFTIDFDGNLKIKPCHLLKKALYEKDKATFIRNNYVYGLYNNREEVPEEAISRGIHQRKFNLENVA